MCVLSKKLAPDHPPAFPAMLQAFRASRIARAPFGLGEMVVIGTVAAVAIVGPKKVLPHLADMTKNLKSALMQVSSDKPLEGDSSKSTETATPDKKQAKEEK